MKPPCEIVVWYVIPSIRSKLAKELLKLGMKQKEISQMLDITQPAVSQYISDKRGHELDFNPIVNHYIQNMAKDMVMAIMVREMIRIRNDRYSQSPYS